MAKSHGKRNVRRAQPAHGAVTTPKAGHDSDQLNRFKQKSFHFSQLKGKVLEDVEFTSSPDYEAIVLIFQDNTFANFSIKTDLNVQAEYLDRNAGEHRVLK